MLGHVRSLEIVVYTSFPNIMQCPSHTDFVFGPLVCAEPVAGTHHHRPVEFLDHTWQGASALPCGPNPIRHLLLRLFCFDSHAVARVFLSGGFSLAQVLFLRLKANVGSTRLRISWYCC